MQPPNCILRSHGQFGEFAKLSNAPNTAIPVRADLNEAAATLERARAAMYRRTGEYN